MKLGELVALYEKASAYAYRSAEVPSTDGHDISEVIDMPARGADGPLAISLPNHALLPVDDIILKATEDVSEGFCLDEI